MVPLVVVYMLYPFALPDLISQLAKVMSVYLTGRLCLDLIASRGVPETADAAVKQKQWYEEISRCQQDDFDSIRAKYCSKLKSEWVARLHQDLMAAENGIPEGKIANHVDPILC